MIGLVALNSRKRVGGDETIAAKLSSTIGAVEKGQERQMPEPVGRIGRVAKINFDDVHGLASDPSSRRGQAPLIALLKGGVCGSRTVSIDPTRQIPSERSNPST